MFPDKDDSDGNDCQIAHWHQEEYQSLLPCCEDVQVDGIQSGIGHGAGAQEDSIAVLEMVARVAAIENHRSKNNDKNKVREVDAIEIPVKEVPI